MKISYGFMGTTTVCDECASDQAESLVTKEIPAWFHKAWEEDGDRWPLKNTLGTWCYITPSSQFAGKDGIIRPEVKVFGLNCEEVNKMTTARKFLQEQDIDVNHVNLSMLTKYTESNIDYKQFPDAEIEINDPDDFADYFNGHWEAEARIRVDNNPGLKEHEKIIFYDGWSNWHEHMYWIATASIYEILGWINNDVNQ